MKNKKNILLAIFFLIVMLIIIFALFIKKNIGNETAAVKLYEDLIDNIVSQYSNDSSEYLSIYIDDALDPLNKELLSEESKKEILSYSKKYNYNIYNMEKEDLILLNDNNYENLNGLCINFKFSSFSYKKAIINVYYYVDNQSSGIQTYMLEYNKNKWKILKSNFEIVS